MYCYLVIIICIMKNYSIAELRQRFKTQKTITLNEKEIYYFLTEQTRYILIDFNLISIVSNSENQVLLNLIQVIKNEKIQTQIRLYLIFSKEFELFSSNFISTLFLFKNISNQNKINISIYGILQSKGILTLIQNLYSGYLSFGFQDFFNLITSKDENVRGQMWSKDPFDSKKKNVSSTKYTITNAFSPLLLISKENFNDLFEESFIKAFEKASQMISSWEISKGEKLTLGGEQILYQMLRNKLLSEIDILNTSNVKHYQESYYLLHFFKFLSKYRLLSFSIDTKHNKKDSVAYYELYNKFLTSTQLLQKPVSFILLFSLVGSSILDDVLIESQNSSGGSHRKWKITSNEDINNEIIEKLYSLFNFVNNIFSGLYELAKNIVQHSEYKSGVLSMRLLNKTNLLQMKDDNISSWQEYFHLIPEHPLDHFIDISIVDIGTEGIFTTFERSLVSLINDPSLTNPNRIIIKRDLHKVQDLAYKSSEYHEGKTLYRFFNRTLINEKQQILSNSSYGTYTFLEKINQAFGSFTVSTNKYKNKGETMGFQYFSDSSHKKRLIYLNNQTPFGTSYNITIPINLLFRKSTEQNSSETSLHPLFKSLEGESTSIYSKMLTLDVSQENLFPILQSDIFNLLNIKEPIVCLNCSNINNTHIDYSNLSRQIGEISDGLKKTNKALILYNLSYDIACSLWEFLVTNRSKTLFWSNDKNSVIQIFYNPPTNKPGYIYSFFLIGSKREICEGLNDYFALNHYIKVPNRSDCITSKKPRLTQNWNESLPDNHPLFINRSLLYLELFIKIEMNGLTIFEENARTLLLTSIESGGYNMQNIHLRIGSKIHLRDFIVAKRFFQNNNYSTGFAFLMAKCIMQNIVMEDQLKDKLKNEYVILGYGYYSELMVSRTEAFLNEIKGTCGLNSIKFSHFIVEDSEEMKIGEYISIYNEKIKNAEIKNIVIVPISSTLTTQLEIENKFLDELRDGLQLHFQNSLDLFAQPYFTVTVVGDADVESVSPIRDEYWEIEKGSDRILISKNIKGELVKGLARKDNQGRRNRYFVYLPSKWFYPDSCEMCGLNRNEENALNIVNNKPLFIADKVSVTPSLIWNLPLKNKYTTDSNISINEDKSITIDECRIDSTMMRQNHKIGTNKHFNFYFNYLNLFNLNKDAIKDWLSNLKFKQKEDILLITPEKSSNGPFVNLINKELFNDKADIMNFSPSEIAIEDFLTYFKSDITDRRKIYYVDNLLATGSNFFSVNNFLVSYKSLYGINNEKLRFSGIITLIDRLNEVDRLAVNRTLSKGDTDNRVFSFVRFNLPVISSTSKQKIACYLCEEETKYINILLNCNLDCIKQYIRDNNLKKVSKYNPVVFDKQPHERETLRFAVAQKLMNIYNKEDFEQYGTKSLSDFILLIKNSFIINIKNSQIDNELKISILKVLSNPPFINYKNIKTTVFHWVYDELLQVTAELSSKLTATNLKSNVLLTQYFKVLIKLASQLQVNYLITKEFLIASNKIVYEFENNFDEEIRSEIQSLKIFITCCIKELLNFNPHLCIVLEKELVSIKQENIRSQKYFDLITLENTEIIGKAIEIHNNAILMETGEFKKDVWYKAYSTSFDELCKEISKLKGINDFINVQESIEMKESQKKSYLYTTILLKYLKTIKYSNENNLFYQRNLDSILILLCQIIGLDESNYGACFIYRDSGLIENKATVISNIGNLDISKNLIENWSGSYSEKMMIGLDYDGNESKHYFWSSAPFSKIEEIWKDHFGEKQPSSEMNELIFGEEINRLYFLRLSDWDDYSKFQSAPQSNAILIFYDKLKTPFNSKNLRYAIFIRDKISLFIRENFTQNTAFWGWIENKQKVEEFIKRYRKNTHGVYNKINAKMKDSVIYSDSELLQIFTDLIIGNFHYNLLSEHSFGENIQSGFTIDQVVTKKLITGLSKLVSSKALVEKFDLDKFRIEFELAGELPIYSYGIFTPYIITSLVMNAMKYKDIHLGTIIRITNDDQYLYISNTNSSENDYNNAVRVIQSKGVPYESISLYVINEYFKKEYKAEIIVKFEIKSLNTFTIALPLTKRNSYE